MTGPLMAQLVGSGDERTEYAMHAVVSMPDGSEAEDWMPCSSREQLDYRLKFYTDRGWKCTPLVRTVSVSSWEPRA